MGEFVNVKVTDGLATIRVDRPPMNALNAQIQGELSEAAAEVGADREVRAAVIYGGPKLFAAGADVKEMADKALPTWPSPPSGGRPPSPRSPKFPSRSWPRAPGTRSAAASNSRCAPISASAARARSSGSRSSVTVKSSALDVATHSAFADDEPPRTVGDRWSKDPVQGLPDVLVALQT